MSCSNSVNDQTFLSNQPVLPRWACELTKHGQALNEWFSSWAMVLANKPISHIPASHVSLWKADSRSSGCFCESWCQSYQQLRSLCHPQVKSEAPRLNHQWGLTDHSSPQLTVMQILCHDEPQQNANQVTSASLPAELPNVIYDFIYSWIYDNQL